MIGRGQLGKLVSVHVLYNIHHPEIVASLTALAGKARADLGDRGKPGKGQRTIGRIKNPTPRLLPPSP